MAKYMNNEIFVKRANQIHNNKYDYSKVNYIDYQQKVCIICPEHGEFWMSPAAHLTYKNQCPHCAANIRGYKKRLGLNTFIERSNKIHNNKYDYSKFEYINSTIKSTIICPEHGEFLQTPNAHLQGQGCPICGIATTHDKQRTPLNEYINKCKIIHNNKYDYSKVTLDDYKNNKICIICPEHGEFWQNKKAHLFKLYGCPKCSEPTIEIIIENKLLELNIKYEKQKTFDWLKYKQKLKLDFYLPDYNIAIECQGIQHFVPTFYNKTQRSNKDIYIKNFYVGQLRDEIKYNLCNEHNIKIFYYSTLNKEYKHKLYNDVNELITDIIKNNQIN